MNNPNNENNIPEQTKKKLHTGISCIAACLMIVYIGAFCTVPVGDLIGFAVFAGFAAVYSLLITSRSVVGTILPPIAGLAAAMASALLVNGFNYTTGMQFINVSVAIVLGLALNKCNEKKAKKSVVFATVTAFGTLSMFLAVISAVFVSYGAINADILSEAIESLADTVGNSYRNILGTAAADMAQNKEVTEMIDTMAKGISASVQLNFVSMLTVYGMLLGAFTVIIYKPVSYLMGCDEKIFEEREWVFTLSGVSAVFFEIIFTVYIFSMLFGDNIVILGAFVNLVNVLVYPFGYVGIKYVYGLLKTRLSSGVPAALIIVAAAFVFTFVTGLNTFVMVAALAGASSVFKDGITPKGNDSDDQI